jgi:hypothetical protein
VNILVYFATRDTVFYFNRVGLVLNFRGLRYTNFAEGANERNFSLKPSNWNYGIVFSLSKDK